MKHIDAILLRAKKQIFNPHSGLNLSAKKGEGFDFAEIALYHEGENAKKIDWKSTAKTGTPHVKLFYEEREANVVLSALLSGSLLFKTKKEKLLEIVAQLGFETLKYKNTLAPLFISQDQEAYLPSSKNPASISHFLHKIDAIPLENTRLDLTSLPQKIDKHIKKKSLIILVGDFLGEIDLRLLAQKHALYLIIIRDSFEEHPTLLGDGAFTDPESGEHASFYFGKSAQKAYAKAYHDNDQKLFKHLRSLGIPYDKVVISV